MSDSEVVEPSATQTLLKKKTPSKSKETQASQQVEDTIAVNAHVIENLSKDESFNMVRDLQNSSGENDFKLGGILRHIRQNGWHEGYDTFDAMVEAEYGIKKRKAAYLSAIYEALVDNQIPWAKVAHIGWTKLKLFAHLLTLENVDEWVKRADMKTLDLEEYVKNLKKAQEEGNAAEGDAISSTVTTLTLKVHEDQKTTIRQAIDKAKSEVNTEYDTVAMEAICIGYLGGSVDIKVVGQAKGLTDLMKEHSFEEVLETFGMIFPDVDLTVNV